MINDIVYAVKALSFAPFFFLQVNGKLVYCTTMITFEVLHFLVKFTTPILSRYMVWM
ncbi:unnamed protein product [Onchocerca flexuosa]|uniref:Uncharacterized protein n=1 Tax=Onchocerca flexuosa TaxID=387005 RepID=A0A183HHT0_9BILA|nr:unnamed protein product [Onchocerca flexuosa]